MGFAFKCDGLSVPPEAKMLSPNHARHVQRNIANPQRLT
jgi:hypothetical protein